jgi:hypothetical protein
MPENIKEEYLKIAQSIGYDTSKLIWVNQDKTILLYMENKVVISWFRRDLRLKTTKDYSKLWLAACLYYLYLFLILKF